jgi:predicted ester cyclase
MQHGIVLRAAVAAGVVAGLVDIGVASVIDAARPSTVLRAISSGIVGMAAYSGGPSVVVLGLALQISMSVAIAGTYAFASRRLAWLISRPIAAGSVFGVAVFIVMNFVVVPFSRFAPKPAHLTWTWALLNVLAMLLFGIVVAIVVRRTLGPPRPAARDARSERRPSGLEGQQPADVIGTRMTSAIRMEISPAAETRKTSNQENPMSAGIDQTSENEQVVRRLYDCIQRNDAAGFAMIVAETHTDHSNGRNGPSGFAAAADTIHKAYSDLKIELRALVARGDLVVAQWHETGIHTGQFFNLRPTNQPFEATGLNMYRVAGGKIVDSWISVDPRTLRAQQAAQAALGNG